MEGKYIFKDFMKKLDVKKINNLNITANKATTITLIKSRMNPITSVDMLK